MSGGMLEQLLEEVRELRRDLAEVRQLRAGTQLITVEAFAEVHALGESTVRKLIRDGRLPATKIGRAVRIAANATIAPVAKVDAPAERAAAVLALVGGRS